MKKNILFTIIIILTIASCMEKGRFEERFIKHLASNTDTFEPTISNEANPYDDSGKMHNEYASIFLTEIHDSLPIEDSFFKTYSRICRIRGKRKGSPEKILISYRNLVNRISKNKEFVYEALNKGSKIDSIVLRAAIDIQLDKDLELDERIIQTKRIESFVLSEKGLNILEKKRLLCSLSVLRHSDKFWSDMPKGRYIDGPFARLIDGIWYWESCLNHDGFLNQTQEADAYMTAAMNSSFFAMLGY